MDKLEEFLKKVQEELATLVKKLKSSFGKSKNKDDDNEEFEEGEQVVKETVGEDGENDGENDDEDETIKKSIIDQLSQINFDTDFLKKNALKIVLGIIIIYLAIDTLFLSRDDTNTNVTNSVPANKPIKKPRRKVKGKSKNIDKNTNSANVISEADKINETSKVQNENTQQNTVENQASKLKVREQSQYKDKESVEVIKNDVKDIPPETSTTLLDSTSTEKDNEKVDANDDLNVIELEPKTTEKVEEVKYDLKSDMKSPDLGEKTDSKSSGLELSDQIEEVISNDVEKENEETEYIEPPTYQRFGRGLVYNCKGKHWACVDHYSYIKCLENDKYNSENNKDKECVVRNTYATNEDCIKVQTFYTNNNEKTDFCSTSNE